MVRKGSLICLVLVAMTGIVAEPSLGRADVIVGSDGQSQNIEIHRALLAYEGGREVLVEELIVDHRSGRSLWLKPLPVEPSAITNVEAPFQVLDPGTRVHEPYNHQVRKRVFGPSVVTLLSDRLLGGGDTEAEPAEAPSESLRTLQTGAEGLFSGAVFTSTITREYVLPEPMQSWLRQQGFRLEEKLKADLASQLNRGNFIRAVVLFDSAPGGLLLARVGPVRVDMTTPDPVFPTLRRSGPSTNLTHYELFVVGPEALVPSAYSTLWDEEPWRKPTPSRGQFHTLFARPLEPTAAVTLDLEQRLGIPLSPTPFLIRSDFRHGDEVLGQIELEPAQQIVLIPSSGQRGSGLDLFLCILLGLTPLIYTPESWFCLWWAARARDRIRHGESGFGLRLWAVYALIVAGFWAFTLEGTARLATLVPLVVALARLTLPDLGHANPRVRVKFAKKKRKAAAKA